MANSCLTCKHSRIDSRLQASGTCAYASTCSAPCTPIHSYRRNIRVSYPCCLQAYPVLIPALPLSPQAAINPGAQLQTLSKYIFTFLISSVVSLFNRPSTPSPTPNPTAPNPKTPQRTLFAHLALLAIGIFDVLGYGLYIYGFAACGSAMSTIIMAAAGQLCTAVLSVTLLKRQLSKQHAAAVALVAFGLMLRSGNRIFTTSSSGTSSSTSGTGSYSAAEGVALVALASVLYSCLGVLYEHMMTTHAGVFTHTQVGCLLDLMDCCIAE